MHVFLIDYVHTSQKKRHQNGENSGSERVLCDALDRLNIETTRELLTGMDKLHGEFNMIQEQLAQCKRAGLEYAYTMGDLYGLILGMCGQYQAIQDIVAKLPPTYVDEKLRLSIKEAKSALKQSIKIWNGFEGFFTGEVDAFRDIFYEVMADEQEDPENQKSAGAREDTTKDGPFSEEQKQWLRDEWTKMWGSMSK